MEEHHHRPASGSAASGKKRRHTSPNADESERQRSQRRRKHHRAGSHPLFAPPPPPHAQPSAALYYPQHEYSAAMQPSSPVSFAAAQPVVPEHTLPDFGIGLPSQGHLLIDAFQQYQTSLDSYIAGNPVESDAGASFIPNFDSFGRVVSGSVSQQQQQQQQQQQHHGTSFVPPALTDAVEHPHQRTGPGYALPAPSLATFDSDPPVHCHPGPNVVGTPLSMTTGHNTPTDFPGFGVLQSQPPESPPRTEPRPSVAPSSHSAGYRSADYSPTPVPMPSTSPARSTSKGQKCPKCDELCKGYKALRRHAWEQHDMYWCHFCPLCSNLVEFDGSEEGSSGSDSDDEVSSAGPLKCLHCDDDDVYLAPGAIVEHFRRLHYHCLSSTRMLFIKRPDDLNRHFFDPKKKRDEGHRWLHEHLEQAKEQFKIQDDDLDIVRGCDRGCDRCSRCLTGLVDFVKHCSEIKKDGLPQSDKGDKAFTTQVRNLLESDKLREAWQDCLRRLGEPARLRWKYQGEQASRLLADLEKAAFAGPARSGALLERAHSMLSGSIKAPSEAT